MLRAIALALRARLRGIRWLRGFSLTAQPPLLCEGNNILASPEEVDYCAIEHYAKSIYPRKGWDQQVMAMLTVYSDASSAGNRYGLVVAGFISTVEYWIDFEKKWRDYIKREANVDCFHMTDFIGNHPPYEDWKGKESKKEHFLEGLVGLIEEHVLGIAGIRVTVLNKDFDAYKRKRPSLELWLGNAYSYGGAALARFVEEWRRENKIPTPAKLVFEDGDKGKGYLIDAFTRDGLPTPAFEKKCDIAALQAADVFAWEQFNHVRNILTQNPRATPGARRPSFVRLERLSFRDAVFGDFTYQGMEASDELARRLGWTEEQMGPEPLQSFKARAAQGTKGKGRSRRRGR
jgi:hypothetical protein